MPPTIDQYVGCLLGLALGDALGAPYEGGLLERAIWRVIGRTRDGLPCWTDDTQMTLDLAESLLSRRVLDQDDLAHRFASSYRWRRGYGPGTARLLRRVRRGVRWQDAGRAGGSFGNGAAMRASVLALFFTGEREALVEAARQSAAVTHGHPIGIEGAVMIAVATRAQLTLSEPQAVMDAVTQVVRHTAFQPALSTANNWLTAKAQPSPREVAQQLGNGMTAPTSCVSALYIALRMGAADFNELLRFTIALGGDVDTIAAMAGTLWGARRGASALPTSPIEQRERITTTAMQLFNCANAKVGRFSTSSAE